MSVLLSDKPIILKSESPPLLSCQETVRLCEGFGNSTCQDEVDPPESQCPAHKRMEVEYYQRKAREQDGVDEIVCWPHLTD